MFSVHGFLVSALFFCDAGLLAVGFGLLSLLVGLLAYVGLLSFFALATSPGPAFLQRFQSDLLLLFWVPLG